MNSLNKQLALTVFCQVLKFIMHIICKQNVYYKNIKALIALSVLLEAKVSFNSTDMLQINHRRGKPYIHNMLLPLCCCSVM